VHRHIGTELEGYVGIVIVFDVLYNFHRCNPSKNVPNSRPSNASSIISSIHSFFVIVVINTINPHH
jgi:hypothetical protein